MHFHSWVQTSKTDRSGMVDSSANTDVKKRGAIIVQEQIFINVNAFSFAHEHRPPGSKTIYFFGQGSLE